MVVYYDDRHQLWLETTAPWKAHSCSKVVYNLWVLGHPARPKQLWAYSWPSQEGHIWGKDEIFAETQLWGDSGSYKAFVLLPNAFFLSPFDFSFRKLIMQFCTSGVLTRNLTNSLTSLNHFPTHNKPLASLVQNLFLTDLCACCAANENHLMKTQPSPKFIQACLPLSTHDLLMLSPTTAPGSRVKPSVAVHSEQHDYTLLVYTLHYSYWSVLLWYSLMSVF